MISGVARPLATNVQGLLAVAEIELPTLEQKPI